MKYILLFMFLLPVIQMKPVLPPDDGPFAYEIKDKEKVMLQEKTIVAAVKTTLKQAGEPEPIPPFELYWSGLEGYDGPANGSLSEKLKYVKRRTNQ